MKKGEELWNTNKAHLSWEELYHELPDHPAPQRILPDSYQCHELKKQPNLLLVKDNFLPPDLLETIQSLSFEHGSWSIRFTKPQETNLFVPSEKRKRNGSLPKDVANAMEHNMLAISNQLWTDFHSFLLNRPNEISHLHAWTNIGPLNELQAGKYHFTHYDCDEYLEFSKGLYRFPPYAAVLYLNIPEDCEGGVTWFPEIKQGVIPKTNRLAIFDARLAHSVLPVLAPVRKPRVVMVMNLWDYETRDEQYELTNGILGYTENRRRELEWLA